eukprot:CAMPEP_0182463164 /NCGR_PEP_ID=MMETSP1319-20130603/7178_1 /TAXON_ID=172717 /ORGANISM="Bolidomonas pacifica, Strain RCC208" /LENGTH=285 /DNA_ID=CAMNT_0024662671 /DNA_START=82 /DNA_END=936 /DNA_ORIENTATION=+
MVERVVPEATPDPAKLNAAMARKRRKSVVADFEMAIAEEVMKGAAAEDVKNQTLRIGLATTEPFVINTKETLAFLLFGQQASDFVFKKVIGNGLIGAILMVAFWVGAIVGVLVYTGYASEELFPLCFLFLPSNIAVTLTQNVSLLKRISKTFDAWLLSFYAIGSVICLVSSVSSWKRKIFPIASLIAFYSAITLDSLPSKIRVYTGRGAMVLCFSYCLGISIMINRNSLLNMDPITFSMGGLEQSSLTLAMNCNLNFCFFCLKVLNQVFRFPKRFSLLTSKLKSI